MLFGIRHDFEWLCARADPLRAHAAMVPKVTKSARTMAASMGHASAKRMVVLMRAARVAQVALAEWAAWEAVEE